MKINGLDFSIARTADALKSVLSQIDKKGGANEKDIIVLMQQSYRLGLLKEARDQVILKKLFEIEEFSEDIF